MTMDEIVGYNIRKRRKIIKMSQETLADNAHVSRQHIYELEYGRKSATVSTLYKLSKVLRVKIDYFFTAVEAKS